MAEVKADTLRFGCPSCGGRLRYDIASEKMKCDRCDNLTDVCVLPWEEDAADIQVTEFHCPQCGAVLYSTDTEITGFCSFCGSDVVLTGKLSKTQRPARIVPFRVTREQCEAAYHDHIKKYPLAPGRMKSKTAFSRLRPVYVPFWSYTVDARGPVRMSGERQYTRKEGRREYLYDETYNLSRTVDIHSEGILFDASAVFEDEAAARLKHTVRDAVPFHPAYLSGFYAHKADVDAKTYEQEAAAAAARILVERTLSSEKVHSVELRDYNRKDFGLPNARYHEELVMIPVWLLVHRRGRRVFTAMINGQNGELVSDVPVSAAKTAGITLALGAALSALLYFALALPPDWLLAFCSLLTMFVQFRFGKVHERLLAWKGRESEPDFDEPGKRFSGPAQSRLNLSVSGHVTAEKRRGLFGGIDYEWARFLFLLLLLLAGFVVYKGVIWLSAASNNDISDAFARLGILAALTGMIVSLRRTSGPEVKAVVWPGILACLAAGVGLLNLLAAPGALILCYGCPLVLLIVSAAELIILGRAYNQYSSRPIPFYAHEETA